AMIVSLTLADPDRTETNSHVGEGTGFQRRRFRVPISQGIDQLVGMGLTHLRGDGIDEPQDRSGVRAAFFLLDALAIFTLAPTPSVILRDGKNTCLGMLVDPFQDRLNGQPQYVGVGQTKLRIVAPPLAVDQRIVFGMILKVLLWGKYGVKGMDERIVADLAPGGCIEFLERTVHLIASRPVFVRGFGKEGLAIFEGRLLPLIQGLDDQRGPFRNDADLGGEPAAAQPLQKRVDPIHRPAWFASGDDEVCPVCPQHKALRAEGVKWDFQTKLPDL